MGFIESKNVMGWCDVCGRSHYFFKRIFDVFKVFMKNRSGNRIKLWKKVRMEKGKVN